MRRPGVYVKHAAYDAAVLVGPNSFEFNVFFDDLRLKAELWLQKTTSLNHSDIEDVVAKIVASIALRWPLRDKETRMTLNVLQFSAYVGQSLRNVIARLARDEPRFSRTNEVAIEAVGITNSRKPPADSAVILEVREQCELVRRVVISLGEPSWRVFCLLYDDLPRSTREVARVLGMTRYQVGTLHEQLHREVRHALERAA